MVLNIVGLELSVPTFFWTVINFFLLMFLLNKFLFKPVMKHLDKRDAYIKDGLKAGVKAEKALNEAKIKLESDIAASSAEARNMIAEGRIEADRKKGIIVAEAQEQASELRNHIKVELEKDEEAYTQSVKERIPGYVSMFANSLLMDNNATSAEYVIEQLKTAEEE